MTTKKRVSEKQAVTIDVDQRSFGLQLKHADMTPPPTFLCRRCGTERLWEEPHGFDCQVATTEQQRKRTSRD